VGAGGGPFLRCAVLAAILLSWFSSVLLRLWPASDPFFLRSVTLVSSCIFLSFVPASSQTSLIARTRNLPLLATLNMVQARLRT